MKALGEEAMEDLRETSPILLSPMLHKLFDLSYRFNGGAYRGEMIQMAKSMGVSPSTCVSLNCVYELSHLLGGSTPFGCTAGVRWIPDVGMVHVRNMDWPLQNIGPATCLFQFGDVFTSVGVAGMVSVVSGMVPKQYSVTVNWAPPVARPTWDWGPLFHLRNVLETCSSYEDAVYELCTVELSTSVFYTVCGTKKGDACIVERTQEDYNVRGMDSSGVLTQANHFDSQGPFFHHNEVLCEEEEGYERVIDDSTARADGLKKKLMRADTYDAAVRCLDYAPQQNEHSYQQMAFCPKRNKVEVWRYL